MQLRGVCGEEVDRGFTPHAAGDDGVTEVHVRQKADHALSRLWLPARPRQLVFQIDGDGMRFAARILLAFSIRQILVHVRAVAEVEGNGAVNLLQRQRRKRRTDRLRRLTSWNSRTMLAKGTRLPTM